MRNGRHLFAATLFSMSSRARGQATATEFRALTKNGGVEGVNFGSSFLNQKDGEDLKQHATSASLQNRTSPALNWTGTPLKIMPTAAKPPEDRGTTVDDAADCIDRIVKFTGIRSRRYRYRQRLRRDSQPSPGPFARAHRGFAQAGLQGTEIRKIVGENDLRMIREVVGN